MALLLMTGNWKPETWREAFGEAAPGRTILIHGTDGYDPADIRYAATWKPPQGVLAALPKLEAIFNLGAGVDALMGDPTLPDVPIVRVVDDNLTKRMGEWVVLQVLIHHRRVLTYLEQQRRHEWIDRRPQPIAEDVRVGFMGYGVLARHAAPILIALGYQVHAWARTPRDTDVTLHVGEDGLGEFLAGTDVLVCLLPLTPDTRRILNARLIGGLATDGPLGGPVLVNAGRGGLQDEDDILRALQSGALAGASLDVFQTEPLPADHPLWDAPNLVITPHNSAISDHRAIARYVAGQIAAYEAGEPLQNVVARDRGY
jgi:glyoxylate/hydroxypyruvate reductase A